LEKSRPNLIPESLDARTDDKFTHDELIALLKRATSLQDRANERVYTTEDIVAAASELDIDPDVVRDAAADLLRRRERDIVPMPFDTRIQIAAEGEHLRIIVPPLRFRIRTTVLELWPGRGRLTRRPWGTAEEFRTQDLTVRVGVFRPLVGRDNRSSNTESPALLLEYGTRTTSLLAGYSDGEQRWLESVINDFLSTNGAPSLEHPDESAA